MTVVFELLQNQPIENIRAIALAIGYLMPDAEVRLSKIAKPGQLPIIPISKLLWYKYILQKPLLQERTQSFSIGYFGRKDDNDMLRLFNSNLFASCSYGKDSDARALKKHACRRNIGSNELPIAYGETKSVLIIKPGLCCTLAEAVVFNKSIVYSESAKGLPQLTARMPEDILPIINRSEEQQAHRENILTLIKQHRLTKDELQKMPHSNQL